MLEGQTPYAAQMNTMQVDQTKLSIQLLNLKNDVSLLLELFGLRQNTARLKIRELNPIRERYEPAIGDCLVSEPEEADLKVDSQDNSGASLSFGNNKIIIQAIPFRIDFLTDGKPVMSFNAKGLLKFEHYRQKAVPQPEEEKPEEEKPEGEKAEEDEEKKEENKPETKEEDEPDMWEETFKTFTDSKPHGPSSVGFDMSFPGFEYVYGIPEHADNMALKSTKSTDPYRLYNLDVFEYELWIPMALYKSVPYMLAHNAERTVGLFWQNAAEMWVDVSNEKADKGTFSKLMDLAFKSGSDEIPQIDTHWFAESGIIDLFIMFGPAASDVFKQFATLTGTTPLPPLFGIAYHQSRWNYNDEEDVLNVDKNFDEHDIPMDVIWLDIEHTDGKRYFTWDASKFPDSVSMLNKVSAKGRKMVTIVDPHIKKDDNYKIYQEIRDKDLAVKDKNDNNYDGWCWPGSSVWPDFFKPEAREYWSSKFTPSEYVGTTNNLFIWNDMNEPSVFNGPEITMHKDAKHFGGWEHRDVHNIYGALVHGATFNGLLKRQPNQRPFVLSRAAFAGSQRYGAVWTGDNTGDWGHLKVTLPMMLSQSLTGLTFSGADIGGFFKNPDAELLTRWYQAAAYQPFMRAHAHLDTRRREPWLLPEENKNIIRETLKTRYSLLPYWYTLFYQGEQNGSLPMRPMWVEFPKVTGVFGQDDQHMVGPGLLVHPVTDAGSTGVNVYLPGEDQVWYDLNSYRRFPGGQNIYYHVDLSKVPVFQRGGYIVPRKMRMRRSSSLMLHDPFTLVVALSNSGKAEGQLYVDDYHSLDYQQGQFIYRQFTWDNGQFKSLNLNKNGQYESKSWIERIVVLGYKFQPTQVKYELLNGDSNTLGFEYDSSKEILTIRRPGFHINVDFTITVQ